MKKTLTILGCLILTVVAANGQNKVNFSDKKISELDVNMGMMYSMEIYAPTFPLIWKDFSPSSEDYFFSGYYTLEDNSESEYKNLNGEVKLIRLQIQVAEGTMNIKEELTFNFINGDMDGPVSYSQYSSDNNGEANEADLKNVKWTKDISISANYSLADGSYKNINFIEINDWEKTKYTITQSTGYDISLDYFRTIINLNISSPEEKPIFKKLNY